MIRHKKIIISITHSGDNDSVLKEDFNEIEEEIQEKMMELSLLYGFIFSLSPKNEVQSYINYDRMEKKNV